LQAKVQGLVTQIQQLQQAVECLELQKERSAAQVQALSDYIKSRACRPAPGKQQPTAAGPTESRKVHASILLLRTLASTCSLGLAYLPPRDMLAFPC